MPLQAQKGVFEVCLALSNYGLRYRRLSDRRLQRALGNMTVTPQARGLIELSRGVVTLCLRLLELRATTVDSDLRKGGIELQQRFPGSYLHALLYQHRLNQAIDLGGDLRHAPRDHGAHQLELIVQFKLAHPGDCNRSAGSRSE